MATLAEQTRVSFIGLDGKRTNVGNLNDLKDKLTGAIREKVEGFDHSPKGFHPENEPLNKDKFAAKKLEKGPNGPGMNDKGPWSKLDKTWKENLEAAKDDELRAKASQIALNEVANQTNKAADLDLAAAKAKATAAAEQYTTNTKANKLKVQYIRHLLEARGKEPAARDMGLVSKT